MMDARNIESLSERGEFYLCLAHAFLTPHTAQAFDGLRAALADDLDELASALGYACTDAVSDFRMAIAAIPDHLALLQAYSALFMAPPRPVQLNTASYLDGALNGGSVAAMEAAYRQCGVERGMDFHDLADHVSIQLEFVALLYLRAAEAQQSGTPEPPLRPEHFLHDYVARWMPAFLRDLQATATPNPWLPLAHVLAAAVAHDARAQDLPAAELRARRAIGKARHERAMRGVTAEDMAFIARKLREQGLATDHLAIPPDLRDEAGGYSRGTPPGSEMSRYRR